MRDQANWNSQPIQTGTFAELIDLLDVRYPGTVRRTVEVCPAAVIKTIDNERDAQETITRLRLAQTREEARIHGSDL